MVRGLPNYFKRASLGWNQLYLHQGLKLWAIGLWRFSLGQPTKIDFQIWEYFLPMAPEYKCGILGSRQKFKQSSFKGWIHPWDEWLPVELHICCALSKEEWQCVWSLSEEMTAAPNVTQTLSLVFCLPVISSLSQVSTLPGNQTFPIFSHVSYLPAINLFQAMPPDFRNLILWGCWLPI